MKIRSDLAMYSEKQVGRNVGPLYIVASFEFCEPIDPESMNRAVSDALIVYPVFACRIREAEGTFFFEEDDALKEYRVVPTDRILLPNRESKDGRLIFIGYHDNFLNLAVNHLLSDGMGAQLFFGEIFKRYAIYCGGTTPETPHPAGRPEDMLAEVSQTPLQPVKGYVPRMKHRDSVSFPCDFEANRFCIRTLSVEESDMMAFVKQYNTKPVLAILYLMAKGYYHLHPDDPLSCSMSIIMNIKPYLGLEKSFCTILQNSVVYLSAEEMKEPGVLIRKKQELEEIRSPECVAYYMLNSEERLKQLQTPATFICSYLRELNDYRGLIRTQLPVLLSPGEMLEARAVDGSFIFSFTGPEHCRELHDCFREGLALCGFRLTGSSELNVIREGDILTLFR